MSLVTEKAEFKSFAYTVKYIQCEKDYDSGPMDYEKLFSKWDHIEGLKIEFQILEENKQQKGIHYHGIVILPKNLLRLKLRMKGYHIYLKEIYNKEVWIKYINKSKRIIEENYIKTENDIINISHLPKLFT